MVSEHQVRERAYFIWEIGGRLSGHAEAHWLQAQAELTASVGPLLVETVATTSGHLPSPSAILKPAAKKAKAAKTAKVTEAKAPKADKGKRGTSQAAALH